MSARLARRILLGLTTIGLAVLAACGAQPQSAAGIASDRAQDAVAREAAEIAPANLSLSPISTYEQACARCHGPQGMFHWDLVKTIDAAVLPVKIHEMMTQQGKLSPTSVDEQAMVAYYRAMHDVGPGGPLFLTVTNGASFAAGSEATLKGEAAAGSVLTLVDHAGAEQSVVLDGTSWSVPTPPPSPFTIKAKLDGKIASLNFPGSLWAAP